MDDNVKQSGNLAKEIVFSRLVKAGKRIYYVDVKRGKNDEMYLSITESKKVVNGEGDDVQVNFEKHKIFVYREDFAKFTASILEAVAYIEEQQGKAEPRPEQEGLDIKIDLGF